MQMIWICVLGLDQAFLNPSLDLTLVFALNSFMIWIYTPAMIFACERGHFSSRLAMSRAIEGDSGLTSLHALRSLAFRRNDGSVVWMSTT